MQPVVLTVEVPLTLAEGEAEGQPLAEGGGVTEEDTLAHSVALRVAEGEPQALEVRVAAAEALTVAEALLAAVPLLLAELHALALGLPLTRRLPEDVAQPVKLPLPV